METFYAIAGAERLSLPAIWNIRESEPWQTYFRHFSPAVAGQALNCFAYPYRVIFVAHATRERYRALASRHQLTVIHNGLNLERLKVPSHCSARADARARLGISDNEVVLLLLGTVCERKGQMDLVEAFATLDPRLVGQCRCFIVGDRPSAYSAQLQERVRNLAGGKGSRYPSCRRRTIRRRIIRPPMSSLYIAR